MKIKNLKLFNAIKTKNNALYKDFPYQSIFIYNDIIELKDIKKMKYKFYQKIFKELLYLIEF